MNSFVFYFLHISSDIYSCTNISAVVPIECTTAEELNVTESRVKICAACLLLLLKLFIARR